MFMQSSDHVASGSKISLECVAQRLFFFFQAEDGIRDLIVTGVQTCALPICNLRGDLLQELHILRREGIASAAGDVERAKGLPVGDERNATYGFDTCRAKDRKSVV